MISAVDLPALGFALLYLVLGLIVAAAMKRFQMADSVGLVGLLVLPLITYGIVSGGISKITAPGGISAEFTQVARAAVTPTPLGQEADDLSNVVSDAEDLAVFEKVGADAIQRYRETLVPGRPVAISLRLGKSGYYVDTVIAQYIRAFLTSDPNLTIIFVDDATGTFRASSNANSVLAALPEGTADGRFLYALGAGDLIALADLIVLTTNSVTAETTNAKALRLMAEDGVDSLVKTDAEGRAVGIVRRDQIMSGLMLGLIE
jgi:hypothetical protein